MATYAELLTLKGDQALLNKVRVAVWIAAYNIVGEPVNTANHVNRLIWAKKVFTDETSAANAMLVPVLAANKAATVAQINGATDTAVQDAVNLVVDTFANGV